MPMNIMEVYKKLNREMDNASEVLVSFESNNALSNKKKKLFTVTLSDSQKVNYLPLMFEIDGKV